MKIEKEKQGKEGEENKRKIDEITASVLKRQTLLVEDKEKLNLKRC